MLEKTGVGGRIRTMRLARNLTLKDIERKANVSATHVSEIERGLTSPTVGALTRIADALEVPACRLLEGSGAPRVRVVRADERMILSDAGGAGRYHRLSGGFVGAHLSMLEIELAAGGSREVGPMTHDGEEFFHVLHGVVELDLGEAGGPRDVLKVGDSIHLRSRPGRVLRNLGTGEEAARVLWVTVPPISF
jgi:transcriptional regulator with XRE-family HTH domain